MRIVSTTLILIGIVTMVAFAISYGRGPLGPESIVGKEVEELIAKSASRVDASLSAAISADPNLLELPPGLEPKRRVKRVFGKIGIVYPAPETAIGITVHQQHGPQSVRCLIVLRGDHVIGIAVIEDEKDSRFANRLQDELKVEFRGYEVQRVREAPDKTLQPASRARQLSINRSHSFAWLAAER